jgi:hypothetical protein
MPLIDTLLQNSISPEHKAIIQMLISESVAAHLDPIFIVSIATLESGLNPYVVGDNYQSFGLFQLNVHGELGKLTPDEAFDPLINTQTALKYIAKYYTPGLDPGHNAANCQRPKYRELYAMTVNAMYPLVKQLLNKLGVYHG